MKKAEREVAEGKTTYLIERHDEQLKLTVPSAWKVTFGPAAPPRKDGQHYYGGGKFALRFYEAENRQRAIFTDVVSFRDLALPMERRVTRVEKNATSRKDEKGSNEAADTYIEEAWVTV
jgi:hypothetical protein